MGDIIGCAVNLPYGMFTVTNLKLDWKRELLSMNKLSSVGTMTYSITKCSNSRLTLGTWWTLWSSNSTGITLYTHMHTTYYKHKLIHFLVNAGVGGVEEQELWDSSASAVTFTKAFWTKIAHSSSPASGIACIIYTYLYYTILQKTTENMSAVSLEFWGLGLSTSCREL